jgi:hypothetical protein
MNEAIWGKFAVSYDWAERKDSSLANGLKK